MKPGSFRRLIRNLRRATEAEQTKWISVTDRLPPHDQPVLARFKPVEPLHEGQPPFEVVVAAYDADFAASLLVSLRRPRRHRPLLPRHALAAVASFFGANAMTPKPGDVWRSKGGLKLIVEDVSADGVLASCQHGGRAWRHTPLDAFLAKHTYVGHDEQLLWICECGTANARQDPRPYPEVGGKTTCRSCHSWTRVHYEHAGVREAWKAGLASENKP